jgi:XTP/dITP diphosphohydrolase
VANDKGPLDRVNAVMKLLIATRNKHKLEEIKAIFALPALQLVSVADFPDLPEVVEDGATFEANAVKKAVTLALAAHLWTLADDSGLEVATLGGDPGVRSARYAGEPVDYGANNRKLLAALDNNANRAACFRCAIALASPSGRAQVVEGKCEGMITHELRGDRGFGYDPLFIPAGHTQTFAEMAADLKNSMSHRGAALRRAREAWGNVLALNAPDWPGRKQIFEWDE